MSKEYTPGGYPDSTVGTATSVIDEDIIPILKAQEDLVFKIYGSFSLKTFSIRVSADTWIRINDGTEIPIFADVVYANDEACVYKLAFKTVVDYSIAYNY